jgi:hypothetical protein
MADQREILRIQRDAMKRAEAEGPFSDAHIASAADIVLVLLRKSAPDLNVEGVVEAMPGRPEKWQAKVRELYIAADLLDETAPGEAQSP